MSETEQEEALGQDGLEKLNTTTTETTDTPMEEKEPDEQVPEGFPTDGPEIGASAETLKEDEETEEDGLSPGDRIKITSNRYGEIKGSIYYLNPESLIRIMPDGVSNIVYDFPIINGEFDPDLGIYGEIELLSEGPKTTFVEWQGFQVDQQLTSFLKDGSLGQSYTITAVNIDKDIIKIKDDSDAEMELDFSEGGIPQGAEFVVLRIHQKIEPEDELTEEELQKNAIETQEKQEAEEELDEELEDVFEVLDETEEQQFTRIQEVSESEKVYDEITQKRSLLDDLYHLLDITTQRNPLVIKRIGTFVEQISLLKNSIIKRAVDGRPLGEEMISLETLSDVLKNKNVPIVRPVLDTKRVGLDFFIDEYEEDFIEDEQTKLYNFVNFIQSSADYMETYGSIPAGEPNVGIPRFYRMINEYFNRFPMGDLYTKTGVQFQSDSEYFRFTAPGFEELNNIEEKAREDTILNNELIVEELKLKPLLLFKKDNSHSYRRAHGPTYRPKEKGGVELMIAGDQANVKGYVLFPYKAVLDGAIGATRTGKLWDSILRSMAIKTSMDKLLTLLGGVTDENDANKIMYLPSTDTTAISVPFSEYLKILLQNVVIRGYGDMSTINYDLGIADMEPNIEQQEIINKRVQEVIASLREMIRLARENLSKPSEKAKLNLISQDFIKRAQESMKNEKHLQLLYEEMSMKTPGYKNVDIALMATMMRYAPDFFIAVLSGNKNAINREKKRFITHLINQTHKTILVEKGVEPTINPCAHVSALNSIRKVNNDTERYALLTEFIGKFKGDQEENWITCLFCKQHLLCRHELLQIRQFLHPNEFDAIQKMIILDFSGCGSDGHHYICCTCGLPIADVDFDKNVEFNDEGVPMMGNSVLVDKETFEDETFRILLGLKKDGEQDVIQFKTTLENELYRVLSAIMTTMDIELKLDTIYRILERGNNIIKNLISEKDYYVKRPKGNYTAYTSQNKIAVLSALLLIEIQSNIPSILPKIAVAGCKANFGGYPFDSDAKPEDSEKSPGIEYFSCVVPNMSINDVPWTRAYQIETKEENRKLAFRKLFFSALRVLTNDGVVQQLLENKRRYVQQIVGSDAERVRPMERHIPGFLPRMEMPGEAKDNAARSPTIPEGTNGRLGQVLQADNWIRAANEMARETANIVKESPFAESSCCFDPITDPGKFFREARLPELPKFSVLKPNYSRQSICYTPIIPRSLQAFNATPSLSLAYFVLLQICPRGPHKGLVHELGYDRQCDWCELTIPDPLSYTTMDKDGVVGINQEFLQTWLLSTNFNLTEASFQDLLDTAHRRLTFDFYKSPIPQTPNQILDTFLSNPYAPVDNFEELVKKVMQNLSREGQVKGNVEEISVALALAVQPLRESIEKSNIKYFIGELGINILNSMLKNTPEAILESIRTYFLIPAQRVLSAYDKESSLRIPAYYKIDPKRKEVLTLFFNDHTKYLETSVYSDDEEDTSLYKAYYKLTYFVEQVSSLLNHASELRVSRLKYNPDLNTKIISVFLKEILRIILYGPLISLLDPAVHPEYPEGIEVSAEPGRSDDTIKKFVVDCLILYSKERYVFNSEEVRQKIEEAKEKEKNKIINYLDTLPPEIRNLELQKRRMGIEQWEEWGAVDPLESFDMLGSNPTEYGGDREEGNGYDVNQQYDDE